MFEQTNGQFILQKDTAINVNSIHSFDFDNNGFHDIAFSGIDTNNQPTTGILLLKNKFKFLNKVQMKRVVGNLESGDINQDGLFDLIVAGKDSTGASVIQIFQNQTTTFKTVKRISNVDSVSMRIADFTSDGKADVAFFSKVNNVANSWIKTFTGDSIPFPTTSVRAQNYGDYDRDGDLDLVQLRSDSIVIFNNNLTATNKGPSVVTSSMGVQLYDRIFFYWPKSFDDHTDSTTVTYDLGVFGSGSTAVVSTEYDQISKQRLLVTHGNTGTANYSLQKLTGNYVYQIQSIDNSFTVQTKFAGGNCSGCGSIDTQPITACSPNSQIQLKPHAPKAMWFSFNKGYLGIHDSLTYTKSESDTIFSFNPSKSPSCSSIRLFLIKVSNTDTLQITHDIWNCENSQNILKVSSEWTNVTWKNNLNSTTATGNPITIILKSAVVYNAFASNTLGCKLKEAFNLKISKPDLKVANNQYQIAKGGSVQLSASGGINYSWAPAEGLNNSSISNPLASPLTTTDYIVTATDSIGCAATASVLVEVMEAGFIPTLFTPNGDGKNDALKIFGLTSASNFRFTIYNREGNVMFDTKDLTTALHEGWSGISNGQSQPSGTYYWKVEGDYDQGGQVTLNGKKSGAFLLLR
jgi:gliding motility-associated-like protein